MSSALASPASARALSDRLPNLDSLRAIAATGIVLEHTSYATGVTDIAFWGGWLSRLDGFVNVFFVLSGFVLFRPYAAAKATGTPRPRTRPFYIRRVLRIVPVYWALVIVSFLLVMDEIPDLVTWVRHLTFTQFYPYGPYLPGVGPAWTLTVEMVFYLLLPLIAIAVLAGRWRPVRIAAILCLAGAAMSVGWLSQIGSGGLSVLVHPIWFPSYGVCFAAGMVMAVISVALATGTAPRRWAALDQIGNAPWACWAIGVGLFGIATTPVAGPLDGFGLPTTGELMSRQALYLGMAICFMLPLVFGQETKLDGILSHPVLRWMGTVSLGLFLWHVVVIEAIIAVLGRRLWGGDALAIFVVTMVLGLGLAALSYYTLERPCQRLGRRIGRQPAATRSDRDADGQPRGGDREYPGRLRPELYVGVVGGQRQPAPDDQQAGREPQLDRV